MRSSLATHPAVQLFTDAAVGAALVATTTAVLIVADADLTFASIVLLLVVVGASVVSYTAGVVAAVTAAASLTYYFTPPVHSFAIDQPDDVLALVAFVPHRSGRLTVARLTELRRRSDLAAREAQLRLAAHERPRGGHPHRGGAPECSRPSSSTCSSSRRARSPSTARAREPRARGHRSTPSHMRTPRPRPRSRSSGEHSEPGSGRRSKHSPSGLATALDRDRLDRAAREQRTQADLDHSRAAFLTAVTHDLRTPSPRSRPRPEHSSRPGLDVRRARPCRAPRGRPRGVGTARDAGHEGPRAHAHPHRHPARAERRRGRRPRAGRGRPARHSSPTSARSARHRSGPPRAPRRSRC